jgi:hypothetical protein
VEATAQLRLTVKDEDADRVGRRFSGAATELALAGYPGLHLTAPPGGATAYGVYWPALLPAQLVVPTVMQADGTRITVPHHGHRAPVLPAVVDGADASLSPGVAVAPDTVPVDPGEAAATTTGNSSNRNPSSRETVRLPLGTLIGARSGDKGGNANVGLWARSDEAWAWLDGELSMDRFRQLLPESYDLTIQRYSFPKLRAINFVVVGLLGEGVASSTRPDPQAKGLGEYLRSRLVDVPLHLVPHSS